jgi:hypothetical protein
MQSYMEILHPMTGEVVQYVPANYIDLSTRDKHREDPILVDRSKPKPSAGAVGAGLNREA